VSSFADSHHVDADPYPGFYFDVDPNPPFHSDADPDPTFQFDLDPDPTIHFFPDLDFPVLQNDPLRHLFTFMRFWILRFTLVRIRI
jgi:hypothetical protein